jgi:hypothetical protein
MDAFSVLLAGTIKRASDLPNAVAGRLEAELSRALAELTYARLVKACQAVQISGSNNELRLGTWNMVFVQTLKHRLHSLAADHNSGGGAACIAGIILSALQSCVADLGAGAGELLNVCGTLFKPAKVCCCSIQRFSNNYIWLLTPLMLMADGCRRVCQGEVGAAEVFSKSPGSVGTALSTNAKDSCVQGENREHHAFDIATRLHMLGGGCEGIGGGQPKF